MRKHFCAGGGIPIASLAGHIKDTMKCLRFSGAAVSVEGWAGGVVEFIENEITIKNE